MTRVIELQRNIHKISKNIHKVSDRELAQAMSKQYRDLKSELDSLQTVSSQSIIRL